MPPEIPAELVADAPREFALPDPIAHDEFAGEFRRRAVTEQRVLAAIAPVVTRGLQIGPYAAGGLASVSASGSLGTPRVSTTDPRTPMYRVTVPATLDLRVRVGVESRVRADVEIDLVLTPRGADPLLLVIDVAPLRTRDVRIVVRGRGLGAAVSGLIGVTPAAITDEVRRRIAKQVSALLESGSLRRGRAIDIASRIGGTRSGDVPDRWTWLSDAEFGRRFLTHAVSRERVADGFAGIADDDLRIGPLRVGPGGLAEVRATGSIDPPTVVATSAGFDITLPVHLDLVVDLARENHFHAEVSVTLHAVPRPAAELKILIDIPPVTAEDVVVVLEAADNFAAMLGRAGKIEEQIAAQVLRTVNARVGTARGRVVDIADRVSGEGAIPRR